MFWNNDYITARVRAVDMRQNTPCERIKLNRGSEPTLGSPFLSCMLRTVSLPTLQICESFKKKTSHTTAPTATCSIRVLFYAKLFARPSA